VRIFQAAFNKTTASQLFTMTTLGMPEIVGILGSGEAYFRLLPFGNRDNVIEAVERINKLSIENWEDADCSVLLSFILSSL